MNASAKPGKKKLCLKLDPHDYWKVRKIAREKNCTINEAALFLISEVLAPRAS